jgi:hypothetical protein
MAQYCGTELIPTNSFFVHQQHVPSYWKEDCMKLQKKTSATRATQRDVPRCGLCGKTKNLTRTECCGNWICDDEHKYVMFSYARNSCHRNHSRYTLCAFHFNEGHEGDWKDCPQCLQELEGEMYVWYGTNEYNFEKLENPPDYKPTKCANCGKVIRLAYDGYLYGAGGYRCLECSDLDFPAPQAKTKKRTKGAKGGK